MNNSMRNNLALYGGSKVRNYSMPYRRLFGEDELKIVCQVFESSWGKGLDFGYQGEYEQLYTQAFCKFQNGGFADAVSSGTAAVFIALQALEIKKGTDIIISPVTDPGAVSPVIFNDLNIIVADSAKDSFNMSPESFEKAITSNTTCVLVTHMAGFAAEMDEIMKIAKTYDIKIIEDCSQAHGTLYKGERVGTFSDIGVFSTMFSKIHATGGCGGLVFTREKEIYDKVRSFSDRGKPFHDNFFDPKQPADFLFPAMNFNQDELSCAIGYSTLSKLEKTIEKRNQIARQVYDYIERESQALLPYEYPEYCIPSLFFIPVLVDIDKITVSKKEFAKAVQAEGIDVNPDYSFVVSQWTWLKKQLKQKVATPNAVAFKDKTFNILFNEKYGDKEINDIMTSLTKVEAAFKI